MENGERKVIVFRTGVFGTWREKFSGIAAYAKSVGWTLHAVDARNAKPNFEQLIDYWNPVGLILDASSMPEMFDGAPFGKLPVVAIANFCGWNSDVAFRKAFKDRFGLSPLQWRATNN